MFLLHKFLMILVYFADNLLATNDTDEYDKCVEEIREKSSYIAERFSYEKTAWMCKKVDEWQETIKSAPFAAPRIYTQPQIQYLTHIRNCYTFEECLPDIARIRKKRGTVDTRVTRKEYRATSDEERSTFHNSLNILKTSMIDGISKYNLLIQDHLPSNSPEAHWGCAFIPFHRELLKQMEVAMRLEKPRAFIPYWDSSLDQGLPNPCDSVLWTEEFTGDGRGQVTAGPYRGWQTTVTAPGHSERKLYRNCGESSDGELYDPKDFEYYDSKTRYQDLFCNCNDGTFELNHGLVHEFVGGHMLKISISPNDPIFFQHHCFVDYIYERFRSRQNYTSREIDYPEDGPKACSPEHYANATMSPFSQLKNIDGLRSTYTDQFYYYAPSPSCSNGCEGPYLFCDTKRNRCLSKVKLGGNCTGFEKQDICAYGKCWKGICDF